MRFPVVLHSDDGVRFGVTVPDLPGCFSSGDTFDEALESVQEAIDLHLECMAEDEEELPVPRRLPNTKPIRSMQMACGQSWMWI
jgi:predicted RNase H-like HicB family nuclease